MEKLNNVLKENRWVNGALPALLIHCCIGSVYCWSLFKGDIASYMGVNVSSIELCFMLAIFFLGMSAAFGGKFVESNVKLSSYCSTNFFVLGLILSAFAVYNKIPYLLYISYGVIMGIGLGIGYISPVKTLMIWFSKYKGLATGIAISGFGLSKVMFSPLIEYCTKYYGIVITLLIMAFISTLCMLTASYLIKKPSDWVEKKDDISLSLSKIKSILFDRRYITIWLMFFINITCGLVLISFEKNIIQEVGVSAMYIGIIASLTAFFNTFGRFSYATLSDYIKPRVWIYCLIFFSSIIVLNIGIMSGGSALGVLLLLFVINMGYGGGFSTLPTLLTDYFGMKQISTIHGFALSAWAWASVASYIITQVLIYRLHYSIEVVYILLCVLYFFGLLGGMSLLTFKKCDSDDKMVEKIKGKE